MSGRGGRDPHLMSIWWVFCQSRDLFVLLLIPESSIPPLFFSFASQLREEDIAAAWGSSFLPPVWDG